MASKSRNKAKEQNDIALQNFKQGCELVNQHPIFAPLMYHATIVRREDQQYPQNGLAQVSKSGSIFCKTNRRLIRAEKNRPFPKLRSKSWQPVLMKT